MRKRKHKKMLILCEIIVLYIILKIYVLNTPTLTDDDLPNILMQGMVFPS